MDFVRQAWRESSWPLRILLVAAACVIGPSLVLIALSWFVSG